ncbi:MAG: zf-HC2 domain-containing protein [Acidobacteriota bacterium]
MSDRKELLLALDCEATLEVYSAALDGEAGLEEIDAAAVHLAGCADCRAEVEAWGAQEELLHSPLPPAEPIETADLPTTAGLSRRISSSGWLAAAAVLLILAALLVRQNRSSVAAEAPTIDSVVADVDASSDRESVFEEDLRRPRARNPFRTARANPFAARAPRRTVRGGVRNPWRFLDSSAAVPLQGEVP